MNIDYRGQRGDDNLCLSSPLPFFFCCLGHFSICLFCIYLFFPPLLTWSSAAALQHLLVFLFCFFFHLGRQNLRGGGDREEREREADAAALCI